MLEGNGTLKPLVWGERRALEMAQLRGKAQGPRRRLRVRRLSLAPSGKPRCTLDGTRAQGLQTRRGRASGGGARTSFKLTLLGKGSLRRVRLAGVLQGIALLGMVLLANLLVGNALLGKVLLGNPLLGTVLLGNVLLGKVMLGKTLLGRLVLDRRKGQMLRLRLKQKQGQRLVSGGTPAVILILALRQVGMGMPEAHLWVRGLVGMREVG